MSTVLITGATGGLGSAVAQNLKNLKPDWTIAVLVRDAASDKAQELQKAGFELRVADYSDTAALNAAFQGIDLLYFVSGSEIANREPQHKNVVEAAKNSGVGHIFYTSVSLNNLAETSPLFGAMKVHLDTEAWIKASGLNYTFLRHNLYSEVIAMFLGNREQILASKTVFLPTGEGKTAFITRTELAEAGANALANAEKLVNQALEFNGTDKVTFQEVAEALSKITGETIAYVSPEPAAFEETMKSYGVPDMYIGMMSSFGQGIASGAFDSPQTDIEPFLGRKSAPVKEFLSAAYGI
ncbi:MAG: SDR family oxidoreductase [Bacteroidetes bacterium]|nr:MAG: SDR family oxidoreductase [Bacteroidota bacterium]